jgi:hypothetical protein
VIISFAVGYNSIRIRLVIFWSRLSDDTRARGSSRKLAEARGSSRKLAETHGNTFDNSIPVVRKPVSVQLLADDISAVRADGYGNILDNSISSVRKVTGRCQISTYQLYGRLRGDVRSAHISCTEAYGEMSDQHISAMCADLRT